ncbi:WD40 repeat domain-containing protein [Deinococcus lacus]|uniref:WD40 repeat domain-containing protein n=1 Tax=Deinococcus lacus TaxID=392561 RepID=A0ABW1YCQ8_9DEIO
MLTPLLLTGLLAAAPAPAPAFNRAVTLPAGTNYRPVYVDRQRAVVEGSERLVLIPRQGAVRSVPAGRAGGAAEYTQFRATQVLPSGQVQSVRLNFGTCGAEVWNGSGKLAALAGDFRRALSCDAPGEYLLSLNFNPAGSRLVTADRGAGLRLWDAGTGKLLGAQQGGYDSVQFRPDGNFLVAASSTDAGQQLELWRSDLSRRISALQLPRACLYGMSRFAVDNERVAFACQDDLRVWNWRRGDVQTFTRSYPAETPEDAPVLYGDFLAHNDNTGGVTLWNLKTGQRLVEIKAPQGTQVTDVAFAPGGFLTLALSDGSVQRYDAHRGGKYLGTQQVFPKSDGTQWLLLTFSGNWGQMLVLENQSGQVRVVELPGG